MTKIVANKGEVIVIGTKYKVQRIEGTDKGKIKQLWEMLGRPPAFGGTYFPKPYSMLGAHICLERMYYTPGESLEGILETEGEYESVPNQPGVIY